MGALCEGAARGRVDHERGLDAAVGDPVRSIGV
jgi:hypothetical protein